MRDGVARVRSRQNLVVRVGKHGGAAVEVARVREQHVERERRRVAVRRERGLAAGVIARHEAVLEAQVRFWHGVAAAQRGPHAARPDGGLEIGHDELDGDLWARARRGGVAAVASRRWRRGGGVAAVVVAVAPSQR